MTNAENIIVLDMVIKVGNEFRAARRRYNQVPSVLNQVEMEKKKASYEALQRLAEMLKVM